MSLRREEGERCSGCCCKQKATWVTFTDLMECGLMKKWCCCKNDITKELHLIELKRMEDCRVSCAVLKFLLRIGSEKHWENDLGSVGREEPEASGCRVDLPQRRMINDGSTCWS